MYLRVTLADPTIEYHAYENNLSRYYEIIRNLARPTNANNIFWLNASFYKHNFEEFLKVTGDEIR